eukprot:gene14085-biopygen4007
MLFLKRHRRCLRRARLIPARAAVPAGGGVVPRRGGGAQGCPSRRTRHKLAAQWRQLHPFCGVQRPLPRRVGCRVRAIQ